MLEKLGDLNVRLVGGGDGPLVILLHGFGAPGDDLVPFGDMLQHPNTRFVFPEAPLRLDGYGGGRAWWHIDMVAIQESLMRGVREPLDDLVPEGLTEAREKMVRLLEAAVDRFKPGKIILGGFSQGAMLSCDVAWHCKIPLSGLVLLSGTLLAQSMWRPLMPARRGLRVFQSHGTDDPLLRYSGAEHLRDSMIDAGLEVDFVSFSGGHEIPVTALRRLAAFLKT